MKELTPSTVRKIFGIVTVIAFVFGVTGVLICLYYEKKPTIVKIIFFGVMIINGIFYEKFYRCPNCGRNPGRVGPHDCCSKCGHRLDS